MLKKACLDGLPFFQRQVQFLHWSFALFLYLFFQTQRFEVVLKGHIQVERISSVGKPQSHMTKGVGFDDEIPENKPVQQMFTHV